MIIYIYILYIYINILGGITMITYSSGAYLQLFSHTQLGVPWGHHSPPDLVADSVGEASNSEGGASLMSSAADTWSSSSAQCASCVEVDTQKYGRNQPQKNVILVGLSPLIVCIYIQFIVKSPIHTIVDQVTSQLCYPQGLTLYICWFTKDCDPSEKTRPRRLTH